MQERGMKGEQRKQGRKYEIKKRENGKKNAREIKEKGGTKTVKDTGRKIDKKT
jgi:hypothetical protein